MYQELFSFEVAVITMSSKDPLLAANRITKGTYFFGKTPGQKRKEGYTFIGIGCGLLIPLAGVAYCVWEAKKKNRESREMQAAYMQTHGGMPPNLQPNPYPMAVNGGYPPGPVPGYPPGPVPPGYMPNPKATLPPGHYGPALVPEAMSPRAQTAQQRPQMMTMAPHPPLANKV